MEIEEYKIKLLDSYGIKIFIRIFGILTFINLLNFFSKADFLFQGDYYRAVSEVFYLAFFVFLDSIIKVSSFFTLSEKLVKPLNIIKWIPFLMMCYLIYSSVLINSNRLNNIDFSRPTFIWTEIMPFIIIPNLGFIIISMLIFYASAILNRNKELKQENDLTI
ncbi:hypothetical protein [Pedobacter jamesrossensis]|uniref:DUF2975 domain-containing protein n=1 Tax=Pedobacter jamesrossensis TaxID=1908238 RepID=A0ABV8NFV8_9SPHI